LTGFADLRGTDDDNLALSSARVAAVKSMLVKEGVSEDQIKTIALGEARALQTSNWDESLVFDRRVTIDLAPNVTMTASN
jgi:outer membrane protein OmpA-like peptidoglycan-associated protein